MNFGFLNRSTENKYLVQRDGSNGRREKQKTKDIQNANRNMSDANIFSNYIVLVDQTLQLRNRY